MTTDVRPAVLDAQPGLDPWVHHDGQWLRAAQVALDHRTQALSYGTGVFEGVRAYRAQDSSHLLVFRLREHLDRLAAGADLLRIPLPDDAAGLSAAVVELLQRNGHVDDAYVRPLAYKTALQPGTPFGVRLSGVRSSLTVSTVPMGRYVRQPGVRCVVSRWRRVPDNALPARAKITGAYANNALAMEDAAQAGADDAVLLDGQGRVAEATTSNVFVVLRGQLVTPPADGDLLPGITRATVVELAARELGLAVQERHLGTDELRAADECFLTGTGVEVCPVVALDGRVVGSGQPGPITTRVRLLYEHVVRGAHPGYRHWLTPVAAA